MFSTTGGSSMRAVVTRSPASPSFGRVTVNETGGPGTSHKDGVSVTAPVRRPTRCNNAKSSQPIGTVQSYGTARIDVSELTTENRAGASLEPPPKDALATAYCPRPTVVTADTTPNV